MRYLLLALLAAGGCCHTVVEYHMDTVAPPEVVYETERMVRL